MSGDDPGADPSGQVDPRDRPRVPTDARREIKRLKRENAELRRANEILKAASAFFATELNGTHRQ
jgi:transposase